MARAVTLVLLLGLLALEAASAARVFNSQHQHLKREVGRRKRGKDGRLHYKEVDAEHFGRAAFDPHYGLDEEIEAQDLGYDMHDIHDATPSVIEHRLHELFPVIDTNHDGVISLEELQRHLYENGQAISWRRAQVEFNDTDTDGDGKVTPVEYLAMLVEEGDTKSRQALEGGHFPDPLDYGSYIEVTRAAMMLADIDHDGGLNRDEFYDFLNPEEGSNIALKMHRLRQDIHDHLTSAHTGRDDDGHHEQHHGHPGAPELALSFDQFYEHMWSQFTVWDGHDGEWSQEREKEQALRKFVLLDTNADNKLTADELLPAFADLHPTENRYARMQAEHMMDLAECKDDRLTLEQMLAVPHAFYGVVNDHDEL
ncbi:hypothetical protein ABPG77_008402 [Micractinium sp. CCAP 211/92]